MTEGVEVIVSMTAIMMPIAALAISGPLWAETGKPWPSILLVLGGVLGAPLVYVALGKYLMWAVGAV